MSVCDFYLGVACYIYFLVFQSVFFSFSICIFYIFLFVLLNLYLFLLAFVDFAMQDPCRPGVRDAVRLCENAGVKVLLYSYM